MWCHALGLPTLRSKPNRCGVAPERLPCAVGEEFDAGFQVGAELALVNGHLSELASDKRENVWGAAGHAEPT